MNWVKSPRNFPTFAVTPRIALKELLMAKNVESSIDAIFPNAATRFSMLCRAGLEVSSAIWINLKHQELKDSFRKELFCGVFTDFPHQCCIHGSLRTVHIAQHHIPRSYCSPRSPHNPHRTSQNLPHFHTLRTCSDSHQRAVQRTTRNPDWVVEVVVAGEVAYSWGSAPYVCLSDRLLDFPGT